MSKTNNAPTTGEIKYNSFEDIIGTLPNPDIILRKAGIANDVYEEMLFDPQVFTSYQKRKRAVQRLNWRIEHKDGKLVEDFTDLLNSFNFTKIKSGLLKALPMGYAVAEILWEAKDGKFSPIEIKARSQEKFSFNSGGNLLYIADGQSEVAPYGKFIVHINDQDDDNNPYGTSLNSRCYWYWRFKKEGWRTWSAFLEKFGTPPLVLRTDEADQEKLKSIANALDSVSSGSNIVIGTDEEIEQMNTPTGVSSHLNYSQEADKQISKVYLGSNSLIGDNKSGNYAVANTQQDGFFDIVMTDAESLADSIIEYLFKPFVEFNYPKGTLAPKLIFFSDVINDSTQSNKEEDSEDKNKEEDSKDKNKEEDSKDKNKEEDSKDKNKEEDVEENKVNSTDIEVALFTKENIENFSLPTHKDYLEKMTLLLADKNSPIVSKSIDLRKYQDNSKSAFFQIKDNLEGGTEAEAENISYALFSTYLYAKSRFKDKKFMDRFKIVDIDTPVLQTFEKARKRFSSKITLTNDEFNALSGKARGEAFKIASINNKKILNTLKNSIEESIYSGEKDWKKRAKKLIGADTLTDSHLTTIYRTNVFGAYNKEHFEEYEKVKATLPYIMYDAVGDSRTRPTHLALDGLVFREDDEIWGDIYPPNGYNCRCTTRFLTTKDAKDIGVDVGKDFKTPQYKPDNGWDYHGGKGTRNVVMQQLVADGHNSMNYADFGLFNKIPKDNEEAIFKNKVLKKNTEIADSTGGTALVPKGTENANLIEDILTKPSEAWLFTRKTKTNKLGYVLKFIKVIAIDGTIKHMMVEVDGLGNFLEMKEIKNINAHRKGYLLDTGEVYA